MVTLSSSSVSAIAIPQDSPAVILAVIAIAIVAAMPDAGAEAVFGTYLAAIISALLAGLAMYFGAAVLSGFPRLIARGFLIYLGFGFLYDWIYQAYFKLSKSDYLLIWLILIIIATVGFLEGVAVGVVVAIILFVLNYSRVRVARYTRTLA